MVMMAIPGRCKAELTVVYQHSESPDSNRNQSNANEAFANPCIFADVDQLAKENQRDANAKNAT
jgi:hypothetical protein